MSRGVAQTIFMDLSVTLQRFNGQMLSQRCFLKGLDFISSPNKD